MSLRASSSLLPMAPQPVTILAARRYLHTVEGRDAEIAQRLSEIAEHGNPAKLPKQLRGLH
jgi:hypothetical protein